MGDVIYLDISTSEDIPVSRVAENIPHDLENVLVIGNDVDGGLYMASSSAAVSEILLLLARAQKQMQEYL